MKLSFFGGVGTVTGSKYLLQVDNKKILIDCGLYQGYKELRQRNWHPFPVKPSSIDAVVLTHAHIDHSGYLPLLVKNGFTGPIYATECTKALCEIMLPDSGHIQEEDAYYANKYGYSKHKPALPLYTLADAEKVIPQFEVVAFGEKLALSHDLHVTFLRAGHILGASFLRFEYKKKSLLFSGDMGRQHDPVMLTPTQIESTDYLVIESTYGDRDHLPVDPQLQLADIVNKTVKRGGSVIIPAFAVGRAQSMLYHLSRLKLKKAIPNVRIFLDSPMAVSATDLYLKHRDEHRLSPEDCRHFSDVATYVNSVDESKELDACPMPIIIISASGMAEGGRVLHHLKAFASDPRHTILFTGYQCDGTRGAKIVAGDDEVKIHGQSIPVRAQVEVMDNMSAHADSQEILKWMGHFKRAPIKTFITHGEPKAAAALKQKIENRFHWKCVVPTYLQSEML